MIYDIAIIGGGPAGAAAGITLLKHTSLSVLIIEAGDYTEQKVGETISPGIIPLLQYLDLEDTFSKQEHLSSFSNAAAWGSDELMENEHLLNSSGHGYHIDRSVFDKMFVDKVQYLGGTVWRNTQYKAATCTDNLWQITATENKQDKQVEARLVIDASGRKTVFTRSQKVKRATLDKLVGISAFLTLEKTIPQRILLEANEYGWWYSAPLPNNKVVVTLMTDADISRVNKLHDSEAWVHLLSTTQYIKDGVLLPEEDIAMLVKPAHTYLLEQVYAANWIATGDAVSAFDPISSLGIGHAISSATHAARAAVELLKGDAELAESYELHILGNMKSYLELKDEFYTKEQRWKDSPFWKRRIQ